MKGSRATGGKSDNFDRHSDDFYATPYESTRAFLDEFKLSGSIYEPCAGGGHIIKILEEYYPNNPIFASDLVDRTYRKVCNLDIKSGVDFLNTDYDRKFDNVVTNPPYKLAKECVEKALDIVNDKVIMFLKIQFLESESRKEFLQNSPLKYVYVFSKRQSPMLDGLELNPNTGKKWQSAMMFAWFVWVNKLFTKIYNYL